MTRCGSCLPGGDGIGFTESVEQGIVWLVLLFVLYCVSSGKFRYDLAAFGGLLLLGVLGIQSPAELFLGFSSPALFTIVAVLIMSAGIVESGLLSGFGKTVAKTLHEPKTQVLSLFFFTGLLSAFMNNVGAIGILLPTAKRMADRARTAKADFALPIVYASILGGSMTLIGTASNLIVSMYRAQAFGTSFRMFDFLFHGLAMFGAGLLILFAGRYRTIEKKSDAKEKVDDVHWSQAQNVPERSQRNSTIVLVTLIPLIVITAMGFIHPAIAFGSITLLWFLAGVFRYETLVANINGHVIVFLGSMFGITNALESTGALETVASRIGPLVVWMPSFAMILFVVYVTAVFAHMLGNTVAAVLMAPLVVSLWNAGVSAVQPEALLMAVAAGASLGLVLPTHQVSIVVMNSMDFPRKRFMKIGIGIAMAGGVAASLVIYALWG